MPSNHLQQQFLRDNRPRTLAEAQITFRRGRHCDTCSGYERCGADDNTRDMTINRGPLAGVHSTVCLGWVKLPPYTDEEI